MGWIKNNANSAEAEALFGLAELGNNLISKSTIFYNICLQSTIFYSICLQSTILYSICIKSTIFLAQITHNQSTI